MSYVTVEVQIKHGQVVAQEPGKLPDSGRGLLTILAEESTAPSALEAFRTLQRELQLTPGKAEEWKMAIREGRR